MAANNRRSRRSLLLAIHLSLVAYRMWAIRPCVWPSVAPMVRQYHSRAANAVKPAMNSEQFYAQRKRRPLFIPPGKYIPPYKWSGNLIDPNSVGSPPEHVVTLSERVANTYRTVLLSNVPTSATPADFKTLSPGDNIANGLGRIEYIYNRAMLPSGQVMVNFSHFNHAYDFCSRNNNKIFSGSVLQTRLLNGLLLDDFLLQYYGYWPQEYRIPLDLIEYDNGKLVVLSNLPEKTSEARLEERLLPRYDLRPQDRWRGRQRSKVGISVDTRGHLGSHDVILGPVVKLPPSHPDTTTASFLVRCQTEAEAQRLVRRWHNTYFSAKTFPIQRTAGSFRVSAVVLH